MPSKKSTTVVLHKDVQKIKTELAGVYGLKNLLSASILFFSRQSDLLPKLIIASVFSGIIGVPWYFITRLRIWWHHK
jgi:hypothetical protein